VNTNKILMIHNSCKKFCVVVFFRLLSQPTVHSAYQPAVTDTILFQLTLVLSLVTDSVNSCNEYYC